MNDIRCTMLIPNNIGSSISGDISDLHLYNVNLINSIFEVNNDTFSLSDRLVIIGSISSQELSHIKMLKDFLYLNVYFISDDFNQCNKYSNVFNCFNLDHMRVSYEVLLSVFYNDKELYNKYKVNPKIASKTSVNIAEELISSTNKDLHKISNDYLTTVASLEDTLIDLESANESIEKLKNEVLGLTRTSEYYLEENKSLISKFADYHNRVMDYNVMFTEDLYNIVNLADYRYPPRVIYFKEYTEFLHLESFIETLVDIIGVQKKASFKVVRLFDSCDLYRYKALKSKYHKINNTFKHSNAVVADYLAVVGNYEKLFNIILNSPLEYLIIIDHKKFNDVVLTGEYLRLNLCRGFNTAKALELPMHNTILNNYEGILSWDTYSNYKDLLKDPLRKVTYLTSRPVMTKIYSLINDII